MRLKGIASRVSGPLAVFSLLALTACKGQDAGMGKVAAYWHALNKTCLAELDGICPGLTLTRKAELWPCLNRNRRSISRPCRDLMMSREIDIVPECRADARRLCPDIPITHENRYVLWPCLIHLKKSVSSDCRRTMYSYSLDIHPDCRADARRLCPGIPFSNKYKSVLFSCMKQHRKSLSAACLRALPAPEIVVPPGCRPDAFRLCPGIPWNTHDASSCISRHQESLSAACLRAMSEDDGKVPPACRTDARKLCGGSPEGGRKGSHLACLKNMGPDFISADCLRALSRRGYGLPQSCRVDASRLCPSMPIINPDVALPCLIQHRQSLSADCAFWLHPFMPAKNPGAA